VTFEGHESGGCTSHSGWQTFTQSHAVVTLKARSPNGSELRRSCIHPVFRAIACCDLELWPFDPEM